MIELFKNKTKEEVDNDPRFAILIENSCKVREAYNEVYRRAPYIVNNANIRDYNKFSTSQWNKRSKV
tara:strand:+ start:391 stop:591 length:201 start_codon:yes stop_codon:yes gene_type:complete